MAKWNFSTTKSDGSTEASTVKRDAGFVAAMAQAHGKNATVKRDADGNVTEATITHSGGTSTYRRS